MGLDIRDKYASDMYLVAIFSRPYSVTLHCTCVMKLTCIPKHLRYEYVPLIHLPYKVFCVGGVKMAVDMGWEC